MMQAAKSTAGLRPVAGGDESGGERQRLWSHHLVSAAVAVVWLAYGLATLSMWLETHAAVHLILLIRNSTLTVLFLARRPAKEASRSVKEWVVALASTFSGYFFAGGSMVADGVAMSLMAVAGVLMTASIIALGRSFGIVPANRGVKTGGAYRIVRHPIYSCYVLFDIGYLLGAPSLRNAVVFAAVVASLYLRARYEEKILRRDPLYQSYTERTRSMFVPGLL